MLTLKRIAYYSKATQDFDSSDLVSLAAEAARFNALDGITGVLFYSDGRFAQIFEGVDEGVQGLGGKCTGAPRHHDGVVLSPVGGISRWLTKVMGPA